MKLVMGNQVIVAEDVVEARIGDRWCGHRDGFGGSSTAGQVGQVVGYVVLPAASVSRDPVNT